MRRERRNEELADVAEDLEQILAAELDGVFDLSPATVRWLLSSLDELDALGSAETVAAS